MNYSIWLQILLELALAVSGEHELNPLLKKASRAFHRKLDMTHITVLKKGELQLEAIYTSPKWVAKDIAFNNIAIQLSQEAINSPDRYALKEVDSHFYYAFQMEDYGTFVMARASEIEITLIKELEPILDIFTTNVLGCIAVSKQVEAEQELRRQKEYNEFYANHDELTKLPNRRKYMEKLNTCINHNDYGGVLLLDLDNFKGINDTLGHVFGDEVLIHISEMLKNIEDESIYVSRFGGDEFQLLIKNKDKEEIEAIAKTIFKQLSTIHRISGRNVEIAFSIGITLFPQDSVNTTQLIMNSDLALYSIKNQGKNNFRFFDTTLANDLHRKNAVKKAIKTAIKNNGFKVVYQPQINTENGQIIGYEALLRLKDSTISPSEFIPVAEEAKSILVIGRVMTKLVVEQLAQWRDRNYNIKPISINFSATQIYDNGYFDFLEEQLALYEIDSSYIEIEVTENVFIDSKQKTMDLLQKFRDAGHTISIDDFGTGYSSLSYLTFLPVDKVKLDRSIIEKFLELDKIDVMESLIALSHSLGLEVVAEGVETTKQYEQLLSIHCDYIQGYYFSKPLEAVDVIESFDKQYFEDDFSFSIVSN